MGTTIFTDFLNSLDLAVNGFLIGGYDRLRDALLNPLRLSLAIFIMVYGVLMLTGRANLSFREAIGRLGVVLFVYVLATSADFYTTYIEKLFVDSPAAIANAVVGGGGATGQNAAMDNFYNSGMDAGNKIWDRGHVTGPWSPFLAAIIVYAITVGVAAYAAFLLALAKIALAVLLILTPLFALFYLFGQTRRLFEGWLSQVIHYALVPILVYGVLALILAIAQHSLQQLDENADSVTMQDVLNLALAGIVAILLLMQVIGVAGAIAGGISLTTAGAFRSGVRRSAAVGMAGGRRAVQWARYLGRTQAPTSTHQGKRRD
ncbi:MAG: type IV secretion system protein [Nevskia sp.]|nr:type IV secretion system protein [Nevskia sp.]